MPNENKTVNANDHGGSEKHDANRSKDSMKSGQQAQGTSQNKNKGEKQQGASDHKSGQQHSPSTSHKDVGANK